MHIQSPYRLVTGLLQDQIDYCQTATGGPSQAHNTLILVLTPALPSLDQMLQCVEYPI